MRRGGLSLADGERSGEIERERGVIKLPRPIKHQQKGSAGYLEEKDEAVSEAFLQRLHELRATQQGK